MSTRTRPKPVLWVRLVGLLILGCGLVALYYGPLEIYCFYMFSSGGRFAMPGFEIGSLWFTYLAAQNMVYYAVAALALPLGLGIIRGRAWARRLGIAACILWLIAGVTLITEYAIVMPGLRDTVDVRPLLLTGLGTLLSGLVLPLALLGVLHLPSVERSLEDRGNIGRYRPGIASLAAICMNVLDVLVVHIAIIGRGAVPAFGSWITGRQGVYILAGVFVILVWLIWSLAEGKKFAAVASALAWAVSGVTLGMTVWGQSVYDVLMDIGFSCRQASEILGSTGMLCELPAAPLVLVPIAGMLVVLVYAARENARTRLFLTQREADKN